MEMAPAAAWASIAVAAVATYLWRALGVGLSGRIDPEGPVFRWVGCVAFAVLAALIARMILLPVGPLEATPFWVRVVSVTLGIVTFYVFRRNSLFGVVAGCGALTLLSLAGVWK